MEIKKSSKKLEELKEHVNDLLTEYDIEILEFVDAEYSNCDYINRTIKVPEVTDETSYFFNLLAITNIVLGKKKPSFLKYEYQQKNYIWAVENSKYLSEKEINKKLENTSPGIRYVSADSPDFKNIRE